MKKVIILTSMFITLNACFIYAQKVDESRMERDIEVSENVLLTLFKQNHVRVPMFFSHPQGEYIAGYGVILTIPSSTFQFDIPSIDIPEIFIDDNGDVIKYRVEKRHELSENTDEDHRDRRNDNDRDNDDGDDGDDDNDRNDDNDNDNDNKEEGKDYVYIRRKMNEDRMREMVERVEHKVQRKFMVNDSTQRAAQKEMIETLKTFLADYGNLFTQLQPTEKIVITDRQAERLHFMQGNVPSRFFSLEVLKSDINSYTQGKITREKLMGGIKVNTGEKVKAAEADVELLSSIFSRLYKRDLSKTFFTETDISYDRLSDFGVIYYMQVLSSNRLTADNARHAMPTVGLANVSVEDHDKKVKELYPQFEQELKENMVDYGRTLKSLGDNESLMIHVRMTKCEKCNIPTTLELSIKGAVLKDYNMGKIDRNSTISKILVKKGNVQ